MKHISDFFPGDRIEHDTLRTSLQHVSVYHLLHRINEGEINIQPDYHRNLVWDLRKKSRLIESLIMNIPLPMIYVSEERWGEWDIIDGVQRLEAIWSFVKDEFQLAPLFYFHELNGLYFWQLPEKYKHRILQTTLSIIVIDSRSSDDLKLEVFRRINTGGMPLTHQEIRNTLLPRNAREVLRISSENDLFYQLVPTVSDDRMYRQELVLQFLGVYHFYDINKRILIGRGDIGEILDRFVWDMEYEDINYDYLIHLFSETMAKCHFVFGQNAFNHPDKGLFHKSLFLVFSVVLSNYDNQQLTDRFADGRLRNHLFKRMKNDKQFADLLLKWNASRNRIEFQLNMFADFLEGLM